MFLHPRCCWSCPAKLNTAHRLWEQVVASQIAGSQDGGGCFSCSSSWQRKARFNTISSFPLSKRNVLPDTRAWRHALPCSKALSETERSPKLQTAIQNLSPFIPVLSQSILACRMGGPFQLAQERVCECVCVCVCVCVLTTFLLVAWALCPLASVTFLERPSLTPAYGDLYLTQLYPIRWPCFIIPFPLSLQCIKCCVPSPPHNSCVETEFPLWCYLERGLW